MEKLLVILSLIMPGSACMVRVRAKARVRVRVRLRVRVRFRVRVCLRVLDLQST